MTYKVGSLNSTPAKDLVDRMSADMVANGWVLVENDYVEGTYTWDVLRSPAGLNSAGNEFFVAIGYLTSGQATMAWTAMKEWNTSTKRATRYLPNANSIVPDSLGYNSQGISALPSTGTTISFRSITLATGDSYYYSVTIDRIIASTNAIGVGTIRFFWYMGLYDSIIPSNIDPLPFTFTGSWYTSAASGVTAGTVGYMLTEPGQTTSDTNNFVGGAAYFGSPSSDSAALVPSWGSAGTLGSGNNFLRYTGQNLISRVAVNGRTGTSSDIRLAMRGLLKDCYAVYGGAYTVGDIAEWIWSAVTYSAVILPPSGNNGANNYKPMMGRV